MGRMWLFILGLGAVLFMVARKAEAAPTVDAAGQIIPTPFDDVFRKWSTAVGLDWRLLRAIATHESSLDPGAVNTADNESIGLMQILCRPDGMGGCTNRLYVTGWTNATRAGLFDPDFNVMIGAQILRANLSQFQSLPKAIATYNNWSARNDPPNGPFQNQAYVDDVLNIYRELGGQV